ncbi:hypothetical protein GCM10010335_41460 [Streptomyces galbus]|nr:hypothetical protein GCM10010335_41460 [Streptomyces galbus]
MLPDPSFVTQGRWFHYELVIGDGNSDCADARPVSCVASSRAIEEIVSLAVRHGADVTVLRKLRAGHACIWERAGYLLHNLRQRIPEHPSTHGE